MNVGFLLFNNLEELDLVGPWEMFNAWRKYSNGPNACFTVAEHKDVITCVNGLRLVPDFQFSDCPPLDSLLVPGGIGTRKELGNESLIQFVQQQAATCTHVLSVCTGALILQAAGLLHGKKATTYWSCLSELQEQGDVRIVEERFVRDGNIWTAAGVSAGIDMALAFIAEQAGEETASNVQLYTEYYPSSVRYGRAHLSEHVPQYMKRERDSSASRYPSH